jgi:Helix-turn-helix of DDE superfamily endonuclease
MQSKIQNLSESQFRRLTGLKQKTFNKIKEILVEAEIKKNQLGGRPNKLSIEDRILMWLEYLREYRTYFHIAVDYQISESACFRNCVWIENVLIKSKVFSLKSKQFLVNNVIESVTVDVTESQVERPKKSRKELILARKNDTTSKLK